MAAALYAQAEKADGAVCGSSRKCSADTGRKPIERVISLINPVLPGMGELLRQWGHSSECFSFIKDWMEKKIRRHPGACSETTGLRLEAVE